MPCPAPAMQRARQSERRRKTETHSRIRKLVFVRHRLGRPVDLSSPRLALAGLGQPARPRIVTAGATALGHSAHLGPCRVPRTHPCSHAMLLHASIAPSHSSTAATCASDALARCSCPLAPPFLLFLLEQPVFHILARLVATHVPRASTICLPFYIPPPRLLSLPVYRSRPNLQPIICLPTSDATRVRPRLTFTSSASVLLHT